MNRKRKAFVIFHYSEKANEKLFKKKFCGFFLEKIIFHFILSSICFAILNFKELDGWRIKGSYDFIINCLQLLSKGFWHLKIVKTFGIEKGENLQQGKENEN